MSFVPSAARKLDISSLGAGVADAVGAGGRRRGDRAGKKREQQEPRLTHTLFSTTKYRLTRPEHGVSLLG